MTDPKYLPQADVLAAIEDMRALAEGSAVATPGAICDTLKGWIEALPTHTGEVERRATLFDAIAHGDQEHRDWLRKAIDDHFAGRPVERPRGKGTAEREVERLRAALLSIRNWAEAYPAAVFTEPDFDAMHEALTAAGMPTAMDAAHGTWGRRICEGVGEIVRTALEDQSHDR